MEEEIKHRLQQNWNADKNILLTKIPILTLRFNLRINTTNLFIILDTGLYRDIWRG